MYNYNHLFYFYITAKSGSVTQAAKRLRISQPALSSQLKVLERALNLKLFQREGRGNQLTRAGLVTFGFCRKMFELSEEMSESLLQRVPSETRRIHIGVSDEVDRPVVTEVVSHFLRSLAPEQRPKLTIIAGSHGQLVERLRFREIDVLISELAVMGPDLANLNRVDSAVALVCSRDWQFKASQRSRGTPSTIARISETEVIQWVMPSAKFKLRAEIDRFFEAHQIKGRVVFESDVMASLVRSVIDGIGMAFLPFLYVGREVREKSVRILSPKGGLWKYRVWLVCCRNNQDDPLIRAFSKSFSFVSESSRRQMV